ncbi:UDP-N-acetylglucosamine pyrophosphorylase, putative [Plasmodium malariae]|uniref:UDP-N-acetylglucosamine diphosphorylase n=1 Tax=Plasmodium malariae TaxID=5858 RepID=A0A1A8W4U6_PLAMA|nr:UDP-N-acetylglucosamine pyrophosphorylase, putative [Plasmodium malariae]SBS87798.1 UDP-N-acetylglucosamine pyrophosphorylase, putative [Plasmodium malariae]SCO93625.1 UDP-N-acetylglucosamine pyrophosphorylase, putative [Plasmodium malariae]
MVTDLTVLKEYGQFRLWDFLQYSPLGSLKNLHIDDMKFFLKKLNEIKNIENEQKQKKEECMMIHAPKIVDIDNIYECKNVENGCIFINMYKKENIISELKHEGIESIKRNEVAVLFLAGGLGSRLGLNKVKGLIEVTPLLNKTFFQFYFEKIKFLEEYCSLSDSLVASNNLQHAYKYCQCKIHSNAHSNKNNSNHDAIYASYNGITKCVPCLKAFFLEDKKGETKIMNSNEVKAQKKNVTIYTYIMTSNYTHDITVKYLEENNFFNLKKENIKFFKQCDNYSTDINFNILLANPNELLTVPSGNGSIFKALDKNCIIDDMIKNNIKYVQIVSIDNVLNKIADPVLVGFCSFFKCDIANKAVKKKEHESMGIFCTKEKIKKKKKKKSCDTYNNTFSVCEYTELSDYLLNNSELFQYGNMCHHIFSLDFLQHIVQNKIYEKMKLHKILRKKQFYDFTVNNKEKSAFITSNVYCYEYFIFDVFKYARKILSFEISRQDEFSPIKKKINKSNNNSDGNNSGTNDGTNIESNNGSNNDCGDDIMSAQKNLSNLHKSWLLNKNYNIIDNSENALNFCEISPLVSYDGTFFFNLPEQKNIYLPYTLNRHPT